VWIVVALAVLFLAYSNGANDNFKGVATLFGSGTSGYRQALLWATLTTAAGCLLALVLASGLVKTFQGAGLVPGALATRPAFLLAVGLGAASTVLLATSTGLPVSTTHALMGGLVGVGLTAAPSEVNFESLGKSFVLPLLFSPIAAMVLTVVLYPVVHWLRRSCSVEQRTYLVLAAIEEQVDAGPDGCWVVQRTGERVEAIKAGTPTQRYCGRVLGCEVGPLLDILHYLSGGAVGFARGVNDAPKIVALMLAGPAFGATTGLVLVTLVMAVGGILNARRVAETMSHRITRMSPGQGLTANLAAASLVLAASLYALPVSTTHVTVGALFGIGLVRGTARLRTILGILAAWLTTLPISAALSALFYLVLSWAV
jgi:PiT family inorganic phosphate transporter